MRIDFNQTQFRRHNLRHHVATVLLGPVLLRQGQKARTIITQLPEPPGERHGTSGTGPTLNLLIIGDSAGAGVGAAHQNESLSGRTVAHLSTDHTVNWRLQARSGSTVPAAMRHLKRLAPESFDWVVVSLGANDVVSRHSLAQWRENLDSLCELLDERFGHPQLLFSGLPPMHLFPALDQPLRWYLGSRAKDFDRVMADWAAGRERCARLPMNFPEDPALLATDGFHPGPGLYRLWGQAVAQHIRRHSGP